MNENKKKNDKRDELLALVPRDAQRILDVGCGDGLLGARLKKEGMEIIGIELDEKLCDRAKENLDQVLSRDVEHLALTFPKGYFDCIIYADILEHLKDPLSVLIGHREFLKSDGHIIASIPNVRYYKIIIQLVLRGVWDYIDRGLLDRTHVHFFTLLTIKELFAQAGYEIIEITRNIVAARGFKLLDALCFNRLQDFLSYQYYFKARKAPGPLPVSKRIIHRF